MSFILLLRRIIRQAMRSLPVLALATLSGCSTMQLAYNQSDEFLYWWMNAYVDFQDNQKQFTRDALSNLQRWHRQQQLPEYVALLKRLQTMAPNDITPAQVCAVTEDMKNSFVSVLRFIEPEATRLGVQLTPEQLRNMRKRYDKTNKDWREDWLEGSVEKRLKYRTKQALNRLEDFYGRLDAPQREVLNQWLSESVFDAATSYAERERRQADSLQTLQRMAQAGEATATTQALLRGWIERSFSSPIERHRVYGQALWQENCEGFAKLHNSTTAAQRQRLADTLRGYENDFRALMSKK